MSLPELTAPLGTPAFQTEQDIDFMPVFGDVPMQTGHARRRRLYTTAPRDVRVRWFLTNAQMAAVHEWFEQVLQVGHLPFAARVKNQGAGTLWWNAKWLQPYKATPLSRDFWSVEGQLRLTGAGSTTGPVASTLTMGFAAALTGTVKLTVTKPLTLSVNAALVGAIKLHTAFSAPLLPGSSSSDGASLREDGALLLREDGSRILRG
jgi:hypothetical protein